MYASTLREWKLPEKTDTIYDSYTLYFNLWQNIDHETYSFFKSFTNYDVFYCNFSKNINEGKLVTGKDYLISDEQAIYRYRGDEKNPWELMSKFSTIPVIYERNPSIVDRNNGIWINKLNSLVFIQLLNTDEEAIWYNVTSNILISKSIFFNNFHGYPVNFYYRGVNFKNYIKLYNLMEVKIDEVKIGTLLPLVEKEYLLSDLNEFQDDDNGTLIKFGACVYLHKLGHYVTEELLNDFLLNDPLSYDLAKREVYIYLDKISESENYDEEIHKMLKAFEG